MRLGLYGGTANNCYVFAHAFAQSGISVRFIRDRSDSFSFSQPVWEDNRFTQSYKDVSASASFPWEWWSRKEVEVKWRPPDWLLDPMRSEPVHESPKPLRSSFWIAKYILGGHCRATVLEMMQACDALIVCGVEAAILASVAGKPYGIWPHGGDIRLAAGLHPVPRRFWRWPSHFALVHTIRRAYKRAVWVGTHDPKGIGAHIGDISRLLTKVNFRHVPIPISTQSRPVQDERRTRLIKLLAELGHNSPERQHVGFVPSRMDFSWKGQDRLLDAMAGLTDRSRPHLIFSGWGRDYSEAKRIVQEKGLAQCVTFLQVSLSKPLLCEMFSACDFAVDQFHAGTYGTAMVEAMACGLPVIMWIDEEVYENRGWESPPVINCRTTADIAKALIRITSNSLDLEEAGRLSQAWVARVHNPEVVLANVLEFFKC